MIVELKKDGVLKYFKQWLNGDDLIEDTCKYIDDVDLFTSIEEHKKGEVFILEGVKDKVVVLSDRLDSGHASNKHHYVMSKKRYKDYFMEVKGS